MFYIGSSFSCTELHDENSDLNSLNLLIIWRAESLSTHNQEYTTSSFFRLHKKKSNRGVYPQELSHKYYFLTPSFLNKLAANDVVFIQNPRDLVYICKKVMRITA